MGLRFNPAKAWFFAGLIMMYFAGRWIAKNVEIPIFDQLHSVAALAIIGIALVSIVKLLVNQE